MAVNTNRRDTYLARMDTELMIQPSGGSGLGLSSTHRSIHQSCQVFQITSLATHPWLSKKGDMLRNRASVWHWQGHLDHHHRLTRIDGAGYSTRASLHHSSKLLGLLLPDQHRSWRRADQLRVWKETARLDMQATGMLLYDSSWWTATDESLQLVSELRKVTAMGNHYKSRSAISRSTWWSKDASPRKARPDWYIKQTLCRCLSCFHFILYITKFQITMNGISADSGSRSLVGYFFVERQRRYSLVSVWKPKFSLDYERCIGIVMVMEGKGYKKKIVGYRSRSYWKICSEVSGSSWWC